METNNICPNCRKPLPPDVPLGLCPECLIKSGFPTGTEPGAAGTRFVPPPVAEIVQLFPQLEILGFIGRGGMGAVYKARQPALDRLVALKVLPPAVASDPGFAERFNREARALARLNHPNIVAIHDFGKAGALHYLLMEFVDGANLREIEQAGKLSPEQALTIVPQICEALQFAHNEGIVHRDIKPENLLLDKKGRVKITDFGIAKIVGAPAGKGSLTGVRDVVGTPHYMAPEQIEKPQTVDHRADIYSLGVVFYEMLTGELPLGKFAPPSSKVHIDVRLDEVVLHSLEKEPARRYQHASEVKTRVENIANTNAPAAAPPVSADELLARDYSLNIRHCLRRGWALVRNDFWPLVGMAAFVLVVLSAASSFEMVWSSENSAGNPSGKTSILGILLSGPLLGGLYLYFLKKIRREAAGVETAFTGFRQPLPHLVIAGFLASLLTVLGFLCLILPGVYLFVAWIFTFPLIVDRRLDFWPAMRLSRKIISKHWWNFLGFLIVLGLINVAGMAACGVGLFITFPVTFAALTYAYEDITGAVKSPPSASALVAGSPFRRGALAGFAVFLVIVVLAIGVTLLLPQSYVGVARVQLADDNIEHVQTECAEIQSSDCLRQVAADLKLVERWNKKYGVPTNNEDQIEELLRKRIVVQPVRNTSLGEISVYSESPSEAAEIANKLAEAYGALHGKQMVDRAIQPSRPAKPNIPLNIFIGAITGIALGILTGVVVGLFSFWRMRKASPPPAQTPDHFWRWFAVTVLALISIPIAIAIIGLLAAVAIPNFVRARQHSQQLAAQQWTKEGWQLWQAQKMDPAAAKFKQAVQLAPDDADAWNGLGWATFNSGKPQEAEPAFQKAISLDTNQPGALNGLGQIYLSRRQYDQAEKYLLKAAPQAPAAWYGLTRLYLLEGKFDQAESWAQKMVDSGQADDLARQMLTAAQAKHLSAGLRFRIEPPPAANKTGSTPAGSISTNSVSASAAVESAADRGQTVAGLPPVVVETWPVSGARDIEPGVAEIRVRFSKEMADGGWSWSTAWENSTPEIIGQPHYESDGRTCVAKVKLEPGRTYAWWLNSNQFKNFTDQAGRRYPIC